MYQLLRFLLFFLPAETSHHLGLAGLHLLHKLGLSSLVAAKVPEQSLTMLGLTFPNPVGLAAGLDKNADYIDALGALGFGFIEVGTITPRPQPGNPKPRLFRLKAEQAIINRMGFNNKGVDHLVENLKKRRYNGVVGVNIGKNLTTAVEEAEQDYLTCMKAVYSLSDYIVVNLSSPNTPGLRNLQFGEYFSSLLGTLRREQLMLAQAYNRYVPVLIKIAPDVSDSEAGDIARALLSHEIDGVVATNTTIERNGVENSRYSGEAGGLSGKPLTQRSNHVLSVLRQQLGPDYPIVGVGGICDAAAAKERRRAGADLLQIYSCFIYKGPALIREVAEGYYSARTDD